MEDMQQQSSLRRISVRSSSAAQEEMTNVQTDNGGYRRPKVALRIGLGALVLVALILVGVAFTESNLADNEGAISNIRRSDSGCPDGYDEAQGDIRGDGEINGKGGGQRVDDADSCARICGSEPECKSFEFQSDTKKCNLNRLRRPTDSAWENQVFCMTRPSCPSDYDEIEGDIPGDASINGKGDGQIVDSEYVCSQLCDSETACRSFEFQSDTQKCNLNTVRQPTTGAWRNQIFCAKKEWVQCAEEGGTCACEGREVKYGLSTHSWMPKIDGTRDFFLHKLHNGGELSCDDQTFGGNPADSSWGTKKCYCRREVEAEWEHCADEGDDNWCICDGWTRYGADSQFKVRSNHGGIRCKNEAFGDPRPGKKKECFCAQDQAVQRLAASDPYKPCADEGGTCECKGIVRFGRVDPFSYADGDRFAYKTVHGSVTCSQDEIGDPGVPPSHGARVCGCYTPPPPLDCGIFCNAGLFCILRQCRCAPGKARTQDGTSPAPSSKRCDYCPGLADYGPC